MEGHALSDADAAQRIQNFATRLIRLARTTRKGSALSSAQYSAMALLAAHPGLSVVDLARREGVAHPTMSRLVAGLEKTGLVVRAKHAQDSRSSLLTLTDSGERLYQEVAARRVMLFRMLLSQLSPGAVQEIVDLVDRGMIDLEQALRAVPTRDM
jgi:DNA-binding MarR family transcriptional regulator